MAQQASAEMLIRPQDKKLKREALVPSPEAVGFEYLSFSIIRLNSADQFESQTGQDEAGLVLLGGRCSVRSSAGKWESIGGRRDVFDGMPYAVYLPIDTEYTIIAETGCEIALCSSHAEQSFPARLITPADVRVEIRGGGNATRQINHILTPEFQAHRLLVVEVYTPSGNWSSYPPHKHDVHNPPGEVDLEEIYYYKIDQPAGYAIQRLYTADGRTDTALTVRDGELVLVREGYHPVVAAHGYNVYYLNALAGSAHSMAASDDPQYAWVRPAWKDRDPRVPLVK
jgi:5-deoxy-glucuronate isomerase